MLRTFRARLLLAAGATFAAMLVLLQWNAQDLVQQSVEQHGLAGLEVVA